MIHTTDAEAQAAREAAVVDENELETLKASLPSPDKLKDLNMTALDFEKVSSCSEIGLKTVYYSTQSWVKFHQKWLGKIFPFLYFFLIHIHVLMLCRKFELIPIKIEFYTNF